MSDNRDLLEGLEDVEETPLSFSTSDNGPLLDSDDGKQVEDIDDGQKPPPLNKKELKKQKKELARQKKIAAAQERDANAPPKKKMSIVKKILVGTGVLCGSMIAGFMGMMFLAGDNPPSEFPATAKHAVSASKWQAADAPKKVAAQPANDGFAAVPTNIAARGFANIESEDSVRPVLAQEIFENKPDVPQQVQVEQVATNRQRVQQQFVPAEQPIVAVVPKVVNAPLVNASSVVQQETLNQLVQQVQQVQQQYVAQQSKVDELIEAIRSHGFGNNQQLAQSAGAVVTLTGEDKAQMQHLLAKKKKLEGRIATLQGALNKLKSKNQRLISENRKLKAINKEMRGIVSTMETKNASLVAEMKKMTTRRPVWAGWQLIGMSENMIVLQMDDRIETVELYGSFAGVTVKKIDINKQIVQTSAGHMEVKG